MGNRTYTLKKFTSDSDYTDFGMELISIEIKPSKDLVLYLYNDNIESNDFSYLKLPQESYSNLKTLLSHFQLLEYIEDFLSFIPVVQRAYLSYNEDYNNKTMSDYMALNRDYEALFSAFEKYLFGDKDDMFAISFKYGNAKPNSIKNFFIQDELYKALIDAYGFSKENFYTHKLELVPDKTSFNYFKGKEYVKMRTVQAIFNFINTKNLSVSSNDTLRACGVFLKICQIPPKEGDDNFEILDINDALQIIDKDYLNHYKNNRLKYKS